MPYSVKGFFEINEDMVQILLMLEVLFTQNSKVEDLFCGASSGSEPSLFFSNYFFSLGFQPIQDDYAKRLRVNVLLLLFQRLYKRFVKGLIETNVNISNELNFSDVYRRVN